MFPKDASKSNRILIEETQIQKNIVLDEELKELIKLKNEADKLHRDGNGRNHIILSKAK